MQTPNPFAYCDLRHHYFLQIGHPFFELRSSFEEKTARRLNRARMVHLLEVCVCVCFEVRISVCVCKDSLIRSMLRRS